jgi:hypothetical protein
MSNLPWWRSLRTAGIIRRRFLMSETGTLVRRRTGLRLVCYLSVPIFFGVASGLAAAEVSERGSYQTSLVIDVPTFHAITPHIQLSYDSNAGDGLLGVGWRLEAASTDYSLVREDRRPSVRFE